MAAAAADLETLQYFLEAERRSKELVVYCGASDATHPEVSQLRSHGFRLAITEQMRPGRVIIQAPRRIELRQLGEGILEWTGNRIARFYRVS